MVDWRGIVKGGREEGERMVAALPPSCIGRDEAGGGRKKSDRRFFPNQEGRKDVSSMVCSAHSFHSISNPSTILFYFRRETIYLQSIPLFFGP